MAQKFKDIITTLSETARRFPIATLLAIVWTTLTIAGSYNLFDGSSYIELIGRIKNNTPYGIPLFISLELLAENRQLPRSILNAIGLTIFGLIFWHLQHISDLELFFLALGLLLSMFIAPFSQCNTTGDQVLCFGVRFSINALVSILAYIITCLGIFAIIYGITYLFFDGISYRKLSQRLSIVCLLVTILFIMAGVPKSLTTEPLKTGPKIKVLSYILLSILTIYAITLHAYIIKVLITQSIPVNRAAYMTSTFGIVSIFTYLFTYPMRHQDVTSSAIRHFPKLLLLPTILMGFLVTTRISDYGLTHSRYFLVICGIWMMASIISMLRPDKAPKGILSTLAALLILTSFGPWSITKLPIHSQVHRLEALLQKNLILVDGKITKSHSAISKKDAHSICSMVSYIDMHDDNALIEKWFPQLKDKPLMKDIKMLDAMGIKKCDH